MSDDISTSLAENLKRLRDAAGLSQQALADKSGVPRPTVAHLESGGANPTLSVVTKLARALGVSLDGLVERPAPSLRVFQPSELPSERRAKQRRTRLLPEGLGGDLVVERILLSPGGRAAIDVEAGSLDVLACERGEIIISVGSETAELGPEHVVVLRQSVQFATEDGAVAYRIGGLAPWHR